MADDYASSSATDGTVTVGGTANGNIETTSDTDWFKTSLLAGHTYQIDVEGAPTGRGTLADPYGSLRNSSGVKVAERDDGGSGYNTRFTYTVPSGLGGTYFVAAGSNNAGTGTYRVKLTDITQAPAFTISNAGTVTEGGNAVFTVTMTGTITSPATVWYSTFSGTASAQEGDYAASFVNQSLTFNPGSSITKTITIPILVESPNLPESAESFTVGLQLTETGAAFTSGTATIAANGSSTPATVDDVREGPDTTRTLPIGELKSGTIDAEPISGDGVTSDQQGGLIDKDWYKVTLESGRTYTFSAASLSIGTGQVAISLHDQNGAEVKSYVEGASPSFEYSTGSQPGGSQPYFLAVSAGGPAPAWRTSVGDYAVAFADTGGPPPAPAADLADDLADAGAPVGSLSMTNPAAESVIGPPDGNDTLGDKDVFQVSLTQGQTYLFTMTGRSVGGAAALAEAIFTIRGAGSFSTILATSTEGPSAQMEFYAQTGGTYYIRTGSGGADYTTAQGGYRLSMAAAASPPGQVEPDGTVDISAIVQSTNAYAASGTVGDADPFDVFVLTAPSDGRLTVDLTGLTTNIDLKIYSMQGGRIGQSIFDGTTPEHVSLGLQAGQQVKIEVDPYGTDQGPYQLGVNFAPTVAAPPGKIPSSAALIGNHLHRTLVDFAAAAYSDDLGDALRVNLATEGWRFYSASFASTNDAEGALAQLVGADGFYDRGIAAAVVARASDAIVLSFRGTDEFRDAGDWAEMDEHFGLFGDLVKAVNDLIVQDSTIRHVYVTGHSLGAAMVDPFMATHPDFEREDGSQVDFKAITFAHPDFHTVGNGTLFNNLLSAFRGGLPAAIFNAAKTYVQVRAGVPNFGPDSRVISFHNDEDPVDLVDFANDGLIPGISNIIAYTMDTIFQHFKQLYVYAADFLSRFGIGDDMIRSELQGPGRNDFLIPHGGSGTSNTLVGGYVPRLMVGGDGDDQYHVVPSASRGGDTIVEAGGSYDVLALKTVGLLGGLNAFDGNVWLELDPNGRDLIVHPVRSDGANLPYVRIVNHFSDLGRVEAVQWANQSVILPTSPSGIDEWNGLRYRLVSMADIAESEAPNGTVSRLISAVGGSGLFDTVSFADLRDSVTANIRDGVAAVLGIFSKSSQVSEGALAAATSEDGIPVDIAGIENVTGSSVNDDITGSDIGNFLAGGGGDDHLVGLGGSDSLDGGEGADRINGGPGADTMIGGPGDDWFRVENLGDRVFEAVGEGRDTVFADVTYVLATDAEIEVLSTPGFEGTTPIGLTGNERPQELWGNDGDNRLDGAGGADWLFGNGGEDTLLGGEGDDHLYGDPGDDSLDGGTGFDTALFVGSSASHSWSRSGASTVISGPAGTDTLVNVERMDFDDAKFDLRPVGFGAAALAVVGFGAGPSSGGWLDDGRYPRMLVDINDDGLTDILGFGVAGTYAALGSENGAFAAPYRASIGFAESPASGGWTSQFAMPRMLADINGDGVVDIVGFGENGIYASLGTGGGAFAAPFRAAIGFGSSVVSGGWADNDSSPRLLADLDGDGRADIVGFGEGGTYVALANWDGTFAAPFLASPGYGSSAGSGGWASEATTPRALADVDGDGILDVVGFSAAGVYVSLGNGDGSFGGAIHAAPGFGSGATSGGWSNSDAFPRLLSDLNADGRADIVGFGTDGTYVALGEANGTFAAPFRASPGFGSDPGSGSWTSQDATPRMLADLNGDGNEDLVGFSPSGVYAAYGNGHGAFGAPFLANPGFGSSAGSGGWADNDSQPRMLLDLNGDGAADILGFGAGGVITATSTSDWVLV